VTSPDEPREPHPAVVDNAVANALSDQYGFLSLSVRYEAAEAARRIVEAWRAPLPKASSEASQLQANSKSEQNLEVVPPATASADTTPRDRAVAALAEKFKAGYDKSKFYVDDLRAYSSIVVEQDEDGPSLRPLTLGEIVDCLADAGLLFFGAPQEEDGSLRSESAKEKP
jgi:hypothetical protein